jgi:fructose-specific phosphotransferase system IIC component
MYQFLVTITPVVAELGGGLEFLGLILLTPFVVILSVVGIMLVVLTPIVEWVLIALQDVFCPVPEEFKDPKNKNKFRMWN